VKVKDLIATLQQHNPETEVLLATELEVEEVADVQWAQPNAEFPSGAVILLTPEGLSSAEADYPDDWEDHPA